MQVNLGAVLLTIVVVVVAIVVLWWLLSRLYQRATTERAFVRTGFLGQHVAISGGALVIPVLHEVTWVSMNMMRISLSCHNEGALITRDRLRLNVDADFYVHVEASPEGVSAAARTLGSRTGSVEEMRSLLDARFGDALRTAAAELAMADLHEHPGSYSTRVLALASEGIGTSGLQIDGVSISRLDQAAREFFNPNNAFDAAGLTILTAEIEERRKRRNEIERDSQVAIERKNLMAEQQMLELQKEEEYARLQQEREIAIRRAQQQSEITVETAEMRRSSQVAEVSAAEAVEKARLVSDRTLREQRVRVEQQIREIEIDKSRVVEIAETERRKALEIAQQATEIEIARHSRQRNEAVVEAELSRAAAIRAEEAVITARELERAEREKQLSLVNAAREIEARGLAVVSQARSEREAAVQRAETQNLLAQAEAEVERLRAQAAELRNEVDARGRRALNEAENVASPEAMALRARLAALAQIEAVVRESARPLEHVSDIKIVHVDGLGAGQGSKEGDDHPAAQASLSDQVMNSALKFRLQAPLVDSLLSSAGINPGQVTDILKP